MTVTDVAAVEAFGNFLSWGEQPRRRNVEILRPFAVPPAWFAYVAGLSSFCPPKGEM